MKKKKIAVNSSVLQQDNNSNSKSTYFSNHHDILYKKGVQKLENLKRMQELNDPEKKQLEECSFHPQFCSKPSKRLANRRRSMDEFYQDQIQVIEKQNELRKKEWIMREQQLIDEKEQVQSQVKHNEKYYSKLKGSFIYSDKDMIFKNQNDKSISNVPSFTPHINEKSKKMKRAGSIETILYEDALDRLNRRQSIDS